VEKITSLCISMRVNFKTRAHFEFVFAHLVSFWPELQWPCSRRLETLNHFEQSVSLLIATLIPSPLFA
jgi:hypothetical protein